MNTINKLIAAFGAIVTLTGAASLASAQTLGLSADASASVSVSGTGAGAGVGVKISAALTRAKLRADQEIDRRDNALNALEARIGSMVKVSADEKTNLDTVIQAQLSAMADLKTKIDADTDAATVKADVQSITKAYRIYMLVLPQAAITAASDRVMTIVDAMNAIGTKLQARISALQSQNVDVSASVAAMTDFNAKVADADTQAQAAVTEISSLKPDNGDQTVMASNTAALKDARKKIQAAQQDLVAARKDAETIVQNIRGKASANANASATVSASGDNHEGDNGTSTGGDH